MSIRLDQITVKEAVQLIMQHVSDKKLALRLENDTYYFLNDHTMNKLMTGLIDENAIMRYKDVVSGGYVEGGVSDAEFVELFSKVKTLHLIVLKPKKDKTKPGGGFFKYHHNTKFDLQKYGIFKEDDEPDYSDNCLVIAFREGGMPDDKLQTVKLFVMNRIVPKCKLKEICAKVQISITLSSIRNDMSSRTEEFGDKSNKSYHIALVDEHYFIIDKTDLTSYCLTNYDDVKHMNNCNMIWCKYLSAYKTSSHKYIDSFKIVNILLDNKDKLLEPIPYDENNEYSIL